MSIAFACTGCGKSFKVKDELAGRKAKCSCGETVTVPQPAPVVEAEEEDIFAFKDDDAPKVAKRAPAMAAAVTAGTAPSAPQPMKPAPYRPSTTSAHPHGAQLPLRHPADRAASASATRR